jgi:hypothetical protein
MSHSDISEVFSRLSGVAKMLQADGYVLMVEPVDGGIAVTIETGGDACPECLAPEAIVRGIIEEKLGESVTLVQLLYPAPHAAAGE